MQYLNTRKAIGLILALAFFIGGTHTALAVGTASNTTITNTATVDYQVGTNPRTATGSDGGFLVDNKVDLTVANVDGNTINVIPGAANQVRTYSVTNTGNTTQGYHLSTAITTANIPMGSVEIWLDTNGNGTWDGPGPGNDTLYSAGSNAFDLNPNGVIGTDDVRTVFVVADTPAAAVNTNQDVIHLVAEARVAGGAALTAAATPTAGVDIVFADGTGTNDGDEDGLHSASVTYTVTSAALAVAKTVFSTTDEFGTGYAIPGANVVYQIRITNAGPTAVDNNTVSVTDQVPANTQLCITTVGTCTAPSFTDGATSSGLALNAFQYSNDATATPCEPGDFTYTPSPDAVTGYDSAVTCVRMTTTGSMSGSGGFFDMQINVGIQ